MRTLASAIASSWHELMVAGDDAPVAEEIGALRV
jgi:hypothetical protein